MEEGEQRRCRICGIDLPDDLEMIIHITEKHQSEETNLAPEDHPTDASRTGIIASNHHQMEL